jgi:YrbI family 3-deoxy-D-manno-octulosonate 8-phosphate phosphatase
MSEPTADTIAIIPARGGSERIARKNLLPLAGLPLLAHSIRHARVADGVQQVYVTTDDEEIAAVARRFGAEVVHRPAELASPTATSESALLHVLDERLAAGLADPERVVFLQCTSPVRRRGDIDAAIETLRARQADSLFSACAFHRLIWADRDGRLESINYDYHRRQREQDMRTQWRENGSIYVTQTDLLREKQNRLGGKIAVYPMDYFAGFQVDEPEHLELIRWIMARPAYRPPIPWPEKIELVVFDFDGVMTDNGLWVDSDGLELVRCDRGDGWGLARLAEAGVEACVLSTEENPVVAARCRKLNLPCAHGLTDKRSALLEEIRGRGISADGVIYVGNDVNDLPALREVGLAVAPADSHPDVLTEADWVLAAPGGRGAVREVCDAILAHLHGAEESS